MTYRCTFHTDLMTLCPYKTVSMEVKNGNEKCLSLCTDKNEVLLLGANGTDKNALLSALNLQSFNFCFAESVQKLCVIL